MSIMDDFKPPKEDSFDVICARTGCACRCANVSLAFAGLERRRHGRLQAGSCSRSAAAGIHSCAAAAEFINLRIGFPGAGWLH